MIKIIALMEDGSKLELGEVESVENVFIKGDKAELSIVELTVLLLLCTGGEMKEISERLGKSIRTVEAIRVRIKRKSNTRNLAELALWGIKQGYVPAPTPKELPGT